MYEYIKSYLGYNQENSKNNILNYLDLVLSNKKKLKEKNLHKYFKVLGGNYKINSDKTINDSYKLFRLGVKNNIDVDTLVNKFKGSAPKLYGKLERKITKKYLNQSESSNFSGGAGEDDANTILTNLSSMSDIKSSKGYSENKLPEYAKLKLILHDDILDKARMNEIKYANIWMERFKIRSPEYIDTLSKISEEVPEDLPETWDLVDVLKYLSISYKGSYGYKWIWSPNNFDINTHTYKTRYDRDIRPISSHNDAKVDFNKEENESLHPDPNLTRLFGSDGLLIGMYDKILHSSKRSLNLIQFLLYWFYYAEPSTESILYRTGWTKIDKEHGNKLVYNPTAILLMRLIEVLHYINVRYLYPQCIIKTGSCDNRKGFDDCETNFSKITLGNKRFLSKLNEIDQSIKEKIQKKLSNGKYSVVFRTFFDFKNFNNPPNFYKEFKYEKESCKTIFARGGPDSHTNNGSLDAINWTYTLEGGIKNKYNYDYRREPINIGRHDNYINKPIHDNYNRGGYDDRDYNYNRGGYDDINYNYNRGGYDRDYDYNRGEYDRYYPNNMHGGALGEFRQEINRNIFNTLREQILNIEI